MSQLAIDPATVQASLRKTSLLVDLGLGASVRQFEDTHARVDRRCGVRLHFPSAHAL